MDFIRYILSNLKKKEVYLKKKESINFFLHSIYSPIA